jgi:hypothetical protein
LPGIRTESDRTPDPAPDPAPWYASKYARLGAVGIVAVAAAVTLAIVLGNGRDHSRPSTHGTVAPIGPIALSASALKARAATLDQPIYWVGPVVGDTYELTRTTTDNVYIRYLPPGVDAGTHQSEYLVIATYPYKGALAALKAAHNEGKPLTVAGGKGGVAAVERGRPTNVHVAFPRVDYQIEVYSPRASAARTLATSGALTPVP